MLGAGKTHTQFILPKSLNFPKLRREIAGNYPVRRGSVHREAYALFDTFDWRLFRKHKVLIQEGGRIFLWDLRQGVPSSQVEWPEQSPPRFWWELPECDLRRRLRALLDVRALLPLLAVAGQCSGLRILNQDQKTVLWLNLCTHKSAADQGERRKAFRLELQPVLGYSTEFKEFRAFLRGMDITEEKESLAVALMRQFGLEPGGYSSKFLLTLSPELVSGEAVRRILRFLFGVMEQNEEGIKSDTDTEFLHDYRVAIRRIRSALGQLKGIFPEEDTVRFRDASARLGQATNALRDLDVYLLKKEEYRALLPDHLVPGLDALFEDLATERKKEHRAVTRSLNSAAYRRTMTQWQEFLDSPSEYPPAEAPHALLPVFPLACRIIFKRYRQILRAGKEIRNDSPDEELHRLRINCKKLRYLLEFFVSLFPEKEMARTIGQLKKLQDNLGDFNDLFIQQRHLENHLEKLEGDAGRLRHSAAAVGGLIASLDQKQRAVRRDFEKRFRDFSTPRNQAHFARLFKAGTKRKLRS